MGEVRTRVWTAVRDRSGVAGKASGRRRGGRSRAERRAWRADSSVSDARDRHLAVDGTWLPVLGAGLAGRCVMAPCVRPSDSPGGGTRSTDDDDDDLAAQADDQGRAPMKRVSWIVSLAAALSSGAAWSQESFAALLLKNSL